MVMLPQLARTGKETATPAAFAEINSEVPTSVRVFIETAVKYLLFVMEIVSARFRLSPANEVSCVSVMKMEDACETVPPNPRFRSTVRVVYESPPMLVSDGNESVASWVSCVRVIIPEMDCKDGAEIDVVAARFEVLVFLITWRFPVMVVMPPKLTVAI